MDQMLIKNLSKARHSAGWTQRHLAERLGTSPQAVKRMEKGVGSVRIVVAAMEALDFSLSGVGAGSTLPHQLRYRRMKLGFSISTAAARSGLARGTVSNIESGSGSIASLERYLCALAPRARRRAQERAYWGQARKDDRDSRFTPGDFMANIYEAFGAVDLDPCGHPLSPIIAKRRIMLVNGENGLSEAWTGRLVFLNPPFSELTIWLRRAHEQWHAGNAETIVCLVPVRTDSVLFHTTLSADADIFLLEGRVRFLDARGGSQATPFSLMLMTFGATTDQKARYQASVRGFWMTRS